MSVNIKNCFKNMVICRTGEHCLYRNFGLNNVDSPYGISYSDVKFQCKTFYPDIEDIEITRRSTMNELQVGQFKYSISVKGAEGNG